MNERRYSRLDLSIIGLDRAVRTVFGRPNPGPRPEPGAAASDGPAAEGERRHSAGLMRVNHSGEIAAQALYQAQALVARSALLEDKMARSADEENEHLLWCQARVQALGGHTSYLNPFWYLGSFAMGLAAGLAGDRWSLGFVAETEHQVVKHLDEHLQRLPADDHKSRAILTQMQADERRHATRAVETGAAELPDPVKVLMSMTAKVMTTTAYWI
ncbi:MAG: 2-polyprenyl-3-methyl-6-methoxy-1,4-benzoquinone monooxygenase [Gammaproteobacteria bacterium]